MKDFLEYLLKLIVDYKDEVKVEETNTGEASTLFLIKANSADIGKIIGRDGKIIQSLRNVLKILAIKENRQIRIEVG